jgi:hypothetical protein
VKDKRNRVGIREMNSLAIGTSKRRKKEKEEKGIKIRRRREKTRV